MLYSRHNKKRKNVMLRKIYRAIILAQAASAANRTLATMSDRILDDIGQSRDSFAKNVVASVRKELDREDREAAAKKLAKNYHKNFGTKPVTANVNPNLVGAV
jgi:uncharacterized protein YjiS (DUF1127 family)